MASQAQGAKKSAQRSRKQRFLRVYRPKIKENKPGIEGSSLVYRTQFRPQADAQCPLGFDSRLVICFARVLSVFCSSVAGLAESAIILRQYGELYQTLAEDILDYVLALKFVEIFFEKICPLRKFMGSFAEKKSNI